MRYNKLGKTDINVSHISLGGAGFSQIYGKFNEASSITLIREALNFGINYLETGPWYGQGTSEITIGKALRGIPRDTYYIGSKVGRYEKEVEHMFDFSAEKTAFSVDNTLELLGLDYIDLIQIHDVTFAPDTSIVIKETLPVLEQAVRDGKVRYIGIADYDIELMKEIIEETDNNINISTILSYAKSTLIDNRLQNYTKYFKDKGIGVINAAATGMGLLTNRGPEAWHPASDDTKLFCQQASDYCKAQNVELARLATWFSITQPDIDTHVCGLYTIEQLHDTLNVLQNELTSREKTVLTEVLKFLNKEFCHWDGVELPLYKTKLNK